MVELVTGGSGSGKSEYAEERAVLLNEKNAPLIYAAAMEPYGDEAAARIARHRAQRAEKGFVTVERYRDIAGLRLPEDCTVLLECMSNLLANEMFGAGGDYEKRIEDGIDCLIRNCRNTVIVTNEVFSDGIDYGSETKEYMRALARLNRYAAERADIVTEVVYGIPVRIKGKEESDRL